MRCRRSSTSRTRTSATSAGSWTRRRGRLVVVSVLDNLLKGAAGPGGAELQRRVRVRRARGIAAEARLHGAEAWRRAARRAGRMRELASAIAGAAAVGRWSSCTAADARSTRRSKRARHREAAGRRPARHRCATLGVVVEVLAGAINTRLVAAIDAAGGQAVGLTGADAGRGRVTRRRRTRPSTAPSPTSGSWAPGRQPLAAPAAGPGAHGYLPVVASIGMSVDGRALNVNADTMAAHLAGAPRRQRGSSSPAGRPACWTRRAHDRAAGPPTAARADRERHRERGNGREAAGVPRGARERRSRSGADGRTSRRGHRDVVYGGRRTAAGGFPRHGWWRDDDSTRLDNSRPTCPRSRPAVRAGLPSRADRRDTRAGRVPVRQRRSRIHRPHLRRRRRLARAREPGTGAGRRGAGRRCCCTPRTCSSIRTRDSWQIGSRRCRGSIARSSATAAPRAWKPA